MAGSTMGKMSKTGAILVALLFTVLLGISALKDFGMLNALTLSISAVLTIVSVLFIFVMLGITSARKMKTLQILTMVVGIVVLLGAVANLLSYPLGALTTLLAVIKLVLIVMLYIIVFS